MRFRPLKTRSHGVLTGGSNHSKVFQGVEVVLIAFCAWISLNPSRKDRCPTAGSCGREVPKPRLNAYNQRKL